MAWRYKANLAMSGLRRDRLRQRAVLLRVAAAGCCCVCCLHPGSHRLEAEQSGAAQTQETRETEAKPADDTVTTQVATTDAVTSDDTFVLSLIGSSDIIASVVVLYWGKSNNTVFRMFSNT